MLIASSTPLSNKLFQKCAHYCSLKSVPYLLSLDLQSWPSCVDCCLLNSCLVSQIYCTDLCVPLCIELHALITLNPYMPLTPDHPKYPLVIRLCASLWTTNLIFIHKSLIINPQLIFQWAEIVYSLGFIQFVYGEKNFTITLYGGRILHQTEHKSSKLNDEIGCLT